LVRVAVDASPGATAAFLIAAIRRDAVVVVALADALEYLHRGL
jgi:hypothetical protein